jgi:hypothetical protein
VKREEKIFLVVFAAVLLCVLGVALSLGSREPSVKIRISQASLSTNGRLTLNYSITQSSHTLLREIESIDDRVAIVSQMGNGSWIGLQTHGEGREEKGIMRSGALGASLLVKTDITYNVTFTNHLVLYNFTNTDGVHYQSDFRMEKL